MKRAAQHRRSPQQEERSSRGNYRDKQDRKARNGNREKEGFGEIVPLRTNTFIPRTEGQRVAFAAVQANTCTFLTGPAGTGKTHVGIAVGVPFLHARQENKLILTNPGVEIGQKLGILPGDKDDKIAVSVRPMRNILVKLLGASHVENLVRQEKIIFEPLGSILGNTYDDAIVILDEAANSTPAQMKALLTRVGQRSKIVVCGDYREQKFIDGLSGLEDALRRLRHLPHVGHVEFTPDDIVRSDFCKDTILAYREEIKEVAL